MGFRRFARHIDNLEDQIGDLVERHEDETPEVDYTDWEDDPVGFIREVLGGEPWEGQKRIAESVAEHPLTAVRSCNSAGKDWTAAALSLWWVYARHGLVLLTGPTQRQVVEILFREIARFFRGADLPGELYQSALKVGRGEQAGILGFTSRTASKLTGFHAPRVFAVLTEAQDIEPYGWEGMLSCAAGGEDRVLALGNPLQPTGRFYQVSNAENWHAIQISATDHPNVREGRELIRGAVSRAFVRRMANEYGEDSQVYRARVEGEFPEFSQQSMFRRSWLEAAARRFESEEFEEEDDELRAAVDPAGEGSDKTALVVRRGKVVTRIDTWHEPDPMANVGRIEEVLRDEGFVTAPEFEEEHGRHADHAQIPMVVVDTSGLGHGIGGRLKERQFNVGSFKAGMQANDPDQYRDAKAEAFYGLRRRFEQDRIALPQDEALFAELLATEYTQGSDGRLKVRPKSEIRERLGRSPDRADALAMAYYPHLTGSQLDVLKIA